MTTPKYADKPIEKWTVNDMLSYVADKHAELYGVEYVPFRSWSAERGLLGNLIGTRTKPRKYSPSVVKRFVDECFASHRVSPQYPGVSFGWFWTYKKTVWQRVVAEEQRKAQRKEAVAKSDADWDELADWL